MFITIYDSIFAESIDVKKMYETLYVNDYRDLSHFLTMHYNIPYNIVQKLVSTFESDDYRLIDFDGLSYGGNVIEGLVMSDDYIEKMYHWLNWE